MPTDAHFDVCGRGDFANQGRQPVLCITNSFHPENHELFAMRRILDGFTRKSGENCGFVLEKGVRSSVKVLGNLDWSPVETRALIFVTSIPYILISIEGLLADCRNLSASILLN
jgi:hypothetical protein